MTNKEDSEKVVKNLDKHIRQAKHGQGYYVAMAIFFFAIPVYVLLEFFYVYAGGWTMFDLFFVFALLVVAVYFLYSDRAPGSKVPLWFSIIGVISIIIVTLFQIAISYLYA
jgi:heme/copper-type cytochrome/quinol oxidase subunit 4